MSVNITDYNILCNLGCDIKSAFQNALDGTYEKFLNTSEIIKNTNIRFGEINCTMPEIKDEKYNLRCNGLILKCLEKLNIQALIEKYGNKNIAVIIATTNSGSMEYDSSNNPCHAEISNPSEFIRNYFNLKGCYTSVSTACSSGIKAFLSAYNILNSNLAKAAIVIGVDSVSYVPIFGFHSLEILSNEKSNPFGKNRNGINLSEGCAAFILEKDAKGVEIAGIGESTDYFHPTTPNPKGLEAIKAIKQALNIANLKPDDIDYINLHGTGTIANDIMEANAIYEIFKNKTLTSSIKPLTGHSLGAAASIETALCLELINSNSKKVFPHIYNNMYDENLPEINLAKKDNKINKIENILITSFGFGGADSAMIIKKQGRCKNGI